MANREVLDHIFADDRKIVFDVDHAGKLLTLELWEKPVEMKGKTRELGDWERHHVVHLHSHRAKRFARLLGELVVVAKQAQP